MKRGLSAEGGTQIDGVWEYGADENVWPSEGGSSRLENIGKRRSIIFALSQMLGWSYKKDKISAWEGLEMFVENL